MTADRNRKTTVQESTLRRNTVQGLHSSVLFSKPPIPGITMLVAGGFVFGIFAYLITGGALLPWDMTVAKTFRAVEINAPWNWMEDALFGIFLGKEVVVLIGILLTIYFLHKQFWRELTMVLIGLGGGAWLWYVLSHYFNRPRPLDHLDVLQLSGSSFPSGSAFMALLGYGFLASLLVPRLPSLFWKWFVALLFTLVIGLVGVSSLLFGTHYVTDVIAGYALAVAWAGLVYTLVERIFPQDRVAGQRLPATITLQGLRVPGLFKHSPLLGILLIVLSSAIFAVVGYSLLTNGSLVQLDISVYKELLAQAKAAPPLFNDIMLFGFFLGKQSIQLIAMLLSLYFLSQRYWLEFGMLQISMQGGGILKNFFIDYFSRPRPPEQLGFVTTTLPSFPSGHTMGTIICYGFLAYLLVPKMPSLFWKWTLGIGIALLILFEGFSRIFHANHYLTDVVGGYALGFAWVVLVCTVMETIFMRRGEGK